MREIFKIIKENFILLLGTGLFTYNLFSFSSSYYAGGTKKISEVIHYYYNSTELILITIGAIFIVIGLIKLRTKKDKN